MGISCSRYVYLFWNKSSPSCSKQVQQSSNSMSTSSSSAPSQRSFGESTGSSSYTTQSSYVTTAGVRSLSLSPTITSADGGRVLVSPNVKIFTFKELKKATKGFDQEHTLGQGGFGMVYKAWLDPKTLKPASMKHGMPVAVKKLKSESMQGLEEWKSEVNFLGSLSHPNLVKLLGYCWEGTELLLVYEFMSKGSLENHLFKKGQNNHNQLLSFDLRVKIAIDAARGLAFLHASEKKIIYRDFKASNILLDSSYDAKISDFGLAKIGPCGGETHVSTRVMGTCGYAAPEYVSTGHLYVKSDVYGYGVVLLELLSGRRALVPSRRPQNLVEWARPILSERRNLSSFMDPRLEGNYSSSKAARAAHLALQCVQNGLKDRPSMNDVLETLKQIQFSDHDDKVRYRRHASLNNGRRILRHSPATDQKNTSVVQEAFWF